MNILIEALFNEVVKQVKNTSIKYYKKETVILYSDTKTGHYVASFEYCSNKIEIYAFNQHTKDINVSSKIFNINDLSNPNFLNEFMNIISKRIEYIDMLRTIYNR